MNKTNIAEMLLVHGADPNLGCPFDVTALQKACERCNPHLVNMILHCGVNWKKERWLKKFVTGTNITCNSEINEHLYYWRTNVMDLQHLTRLAIRRILYENLAEKLNCLHIPQKLKGYILLSDIRTDNFDMTK
ncbi:hypothetical protein FSP39_016307 [Pinctada imbricata]|uniref:SOCS box domain-containing protein n=1 Tax=Pinctada imbricata TaxID=66713 RepID=A0AA89BV02_PINIB|nr:hypothetical protein FSP39_016307 [Pinctada imbricata]